MKKDVYVALSGGVDSAAAAVILKNAGYNVMGVTLRLKPDSLADGDIVDARKVAHTLNIPLTVLDKREDFKKITDYFCREYLNGRTPNPCVKCNPEVKFGILTEFAREKGALLATGHYSEIIRDSEGFYFIKRNPSSKDQSYFLCRLGQNILENVIFPLSSYSKDEIRDIAEIAGVPVAQKKDSQEVCFIPDNDYISFIKTQFNPPDLLGDFLSPEGEKLGTHQGLYKYTVGQRKGLGAFGKPMYVLSIDKEKNAVIIGDNADLFKSEIFIEDVFFTKGEAPAECFEAQVKIRCAAKPAQCKISLCDNRWTINFTEPQRAAAPGQTAAIYIDDILIGGGTICNH